MLKVNKKDEPQFFTEFKRKKNPKNWDELDKLENRYIKKELKYHILKNEQNIGDKSYCSYCEIILFSENKTCGHSKQSIWDDKLFINPVEENPEEYFSYSMRTGKIIPKKENGLEYEKAVKTIEILNLNEDNLCEYRKTYMLKIIDTIGNLNDNNKIEIINYFDEFPTLKKFLIENIEIFYEK